MAGLPLAFNSLMVQVGAGHLWYDPQLPATGARPTLTAAADGTLTPDATLSPSAVHMGMTLEGSKVTIKPEPEYYNSDEQAAPIIAAFNTVEAKIEGTMIQTLDTIIAAKLMGVGTRSAGAGYEQITIGDSQAITTYPVILIAPIYSDPTKIIAVQLYKTFNAAGFEMDIARKKMAASPYSFTGLSIASRPQIDRVGIVWKTIA
jgi:hypothetical protein